MATVQRSLWALLLLLVEQASSAKELLKGISYGPSPKLSLGLLPNDDFMSEATRPQWGPDGRGDLAMMRKMGANAVRLYGNDPRENHQGFLDEAERVGLGVIPGLSDWPYLQAPDSCRTTSYNCFRQAKDAYNQTLLSGFLQDGSYHPAVKYMIAVNEPDMKLPHEGEPWSFTKALITALDGMLDAEKEANVTGALPNITVTFSFSICTRCGSLANKPALGQMWQLTDAMANPSKYGYTARNNLRELYRTRFVNSLNTANPSFELPKLFLDDYEKAFPGTPVFIAEYHAPNQETKKDLTYALELSWNSSLLLGVSFFEWENRLDEQGHTTFGLFTLEQRAMGKMMFFGQEYEVPCLVAAKGFYGESLPKAVAKAYNGTYYTKDGCKAGRFVITTTTTTTTTTTSSSTSSTSSTSDLTSSTTEQAGSPAEVKPAIRGTKRPAAAPSAVEPWPGVAAFSGASPGAAAHRAVALATVLLVAGPWAAVRT